MVPDHEMRTLLEEFDRLTERLREETKTVSRVWEALGISTFEEARGKAIWDLVAELRQDAFDLGFKAAGGSIYSINTEISPGRSGSLPSGESDPSVMLDQAGADTCPVCGGDCAGANPPVFNCPKQTISPMPSAERKSE